jgi:Tc5 transposase DNA-binding domain
MASSASSSSAPSSSVAGLHFKPAKADKAVVRNLTLQQKVEIFDLLDRFQKGEKLVLDGTVVKYEYEVGIPYGVKKAEVSRLKGLSNEAKNKIRKDAKDRESGIPGNRTRVQVCCFCFACYVFFLFASLAFVQAGYFEPLDRAVFHFIAALRANNMPVTVALVKQKAKDVAEGLVKELADADEETKRKIHYENLRKFEASQGWYSSFVRRYQLITGKLIGKPILFLSFFGLLLFVTCLLFVLCR